MDQSEVFEGIGKYDVNILFSNIKTPAYVIDEVRLKSNGSILKSVQDRTGCKILLAQKAFSNYNMYKIMEPYLAGTEASGLYEARLGAEEMPQGEVHVFCGAYKEEDMDEIFKYADHIVFNSINQLMKFGASAKQAGKSIGIRINPERSTQDGHGIYDPCAPGSRLGVTIEQWQKHMTPELLEMLDGVHFHTLCEQNSECLMLTLEAVEEKFGQYLSEMSWINFGGGHHITRKDYNVERLVECIQRISKKYDVEIYLEPGEACALNAGYMVTKILDIVENCGKKIAILDTSAACHMPDVIEMPYTPPLLGAMAVKNDELLNGHIFGESNEDGFQYILAGPTCLAGDVIGSYIFEHELKTGDMLVFGDMAIYTTCKNNTFNGMPLPDIYSLKSNGDIEGLVTFGYEDFKGRLGR